MSRVKRGTQHVKHRKNILELTKGFRGGLRNRIKIAKTAGTKAGAHAYRDRRVKKRNSRRLWQVRINAAVRMLGLSYSAFTGQLKKKEVGLDRKVLSEIAAQQPETFKKIAEFVK
ncbi:MAG: 50S ribosomal protein L20 [Candidatus Magasanikbacteria bacterium CG_4_9_14_0_2_um_filter_41_10]|uniref:Large ribosomal subunit protein bL20 n=1 Tax=Candidatus Magasanikbacteria bacterium CG_4_10_14_0_2_um_filter_41_31 TaxID=1974639 RepID=A0A2M7V2F2_9BACT|nr:MAG: 50S ribosomal protein L20 [Candidatus Magasanikbacteria bacterium CG1_02_41_34]PIZ92504.1 MAG: 50S ribosomal protein L20 [Candidatus Magasanikbacteria bacterium CG_4_10_14_0_2_um_filter_41_31]PJC53385.1 MAG: 50S ribosomal protein L20 [Candidatus Magasanikbacteria bacterium CG_4_9_14_0_2_um_filter_41_10]